MADRPTPSPPPSPPADPLAAALRANLHKRKERMRAARDGATDPGTQRPTGGGGAAIDSFGADEEGDVPVAGGDADAGGWVSIGSKR